MLGGPKGDAALRPTLRGVAYDALCEDQVVDLIIERAKAGTGGRVVTPNVDILRQGLASDDLRGLLSTADIVVADGMPIVWALRLQRTPVPERVAGSSLGPKLAAAAADAGIGVFLLGASPGVALQGAERLRREMPGLKIGWHFPPMGFENRPEERMAVDAALEQFGPAVCFCGLGFPKQDRLGSELLVRFPQSWFIGAGATIAFMAGDVSRAPQWMQRSGLEWLHRLMLEPRRLAERYLRHDLPFTISLLVGSAITGLRTGKNRG